MKIELRNNSVHISGYVNVVERFSKTLPAEMSGGNSSVPFREQIAAGAFSRAIAENSAVEWKFNHDRTLGSTKTGEIRLREDNVGLYAEGDTGDPEVIEAARSGKITGWSFGFSNPTDSWEEATPRKRTLHSFALAEVSVLTLSPAYIGTSAQVRALDGENAINIRCSGDEDIPAPGIKPIPNYNYEIEALRLKGENYG